MTDTLRERVRERLLELIAKEIWVMDERDKFYGAADLADAILREFRLQPVAVGKVTGEGEVEGL